jgi:hypothetical protein
MYVFVSPWLKGGMDGEGIALLGCAGSKDLSSYLGIRSRRAFGYACVYRIIIWYIFFSSLHIDERFSCSFLSNLTWSSPKFCLFYLRWKEK